MLETQFKDKLINIDQVDHYIDGSISAPIYLRNIYVYDFGLVYKYWLFNRVIQILKSIPTYHSYILRSNTARPVVKNQFQQMNKTMDHVDRFMCAVTWYAKV